jgi:hypothetical protein
MMQIGPAHATKNVNDVGCLNFLYHQVEYSIFAHKNMLIIELVQHAFAIDLPAGRYLSSFIKGDLDICGSKTPSTAEETPTSSRQDIWAQLRNGNVPS